MVTLRSKEVITTKEGPVPVMHPHLLKVLKPAPTFPQGKEIKCFIAEYDNKRYAVFTASFVRVDNYHVFESLDELNEHFEEL